MKAKFGRYVFLKKIAIGGMAEIYLARRMSFGGFAKFVVIKRLLPEHRGRKAYERLFLTEARTGSVLNHPHIVSLHDLGKLDDTYFMAMEYVHGASGAELMSMAAHARKPLPLGVTLRIVACVADALHYCTSTPDLDGQPLGVLHHDVSPHNVQISFDGEVKLLDFGVATRMGRPAPGGRRGKFAYMSPEAMDKGDIDQRSDLYSLGVVLYELSLGRRLFKGNTPEETRAAAEARKIPRPADLDPYYPPSLQEVVLTALSPDPAARFQDGQAFAHAVHDVARRVGADTSAEAMARYCRDLYGEEIERRRLELLELAEATSPRRERVAQPADDDEPAADSMEQPPTADSLEHPPEESAAALAAASGDASPIPDEEEPEAEAAPPPPEEGPAPPTPSPAPELEEEPTAEATAESTPSPAPDTEEPAAVAAPETLPKEYGAPEEPAESFDLPPGANDADEPDWDRNERAAPPAPAPRGGAPIWITIAAALVLGARQTGTLWIDSEPRGARVYDGDQTLGITPFETPPAPVGKVYHLRVTMPGRVEWAREVRLDPDHPHRSVLVALLPGGGG